MGLLRDSYHMKHGTPINISGTPMKSFKEYLRETNDFSDQKFGDDDGNTFSVPKLYDFAKEHGTVAHIAIEDTDALEWWHKSYSMDNAEHVKRMMSADTSFPVLAVQQEDGTHSIADGLNRIKKAHSVENKTHVPAIVIKQSDLDRFKKKP